MRQTSLQRYTQFGVGLGIIFFLLLSGCSGGSGGGGGVPPTTGPTPPPTATHLTSIAITPASATVAKGAKAKLTATASYSDKTTADVSASATWASADPKTASVGNNGMVTGVAVGATTVTASLQGITSSPDSVTVTAPGLTAIAITPGSVTVAKGTTTTFTASGTYSDGTTGDVSGSAVWTSANPNIVSVGSSGIATANAAGTTTITAAMNGITSSAASITVSSATLSQISITPASPSIATGTSTQLTATGVYSDGSSANLTSSVTWQSANPAIAKMGIAGVVSGVAVGSTTVTATSGSIASQPDTITVISPAAALDQWTTQTSMLYQRDNDANAVLNGMVYVFGGAPTGTSVLSSMEVYDPVSNTWPAFNIATLSPWPSMPVPRYGLSAVAANNVIYVMGGTQAVNGQGPIYDLLAFDPATNTFSSTVPGTATPLAKLPTGRWGFHSVAIDGLIYAVGGSVFVPGGITATNYSATVSATTTSATLTTLNPAATPPKPLTNGTSYYFVVTAVDAATGKEGPASVEISATPQASFGMGVAPSALGTVAGDRQATLSWVGVAGANSYNVYYGFKSNDSMANMTKVSGVTGTSTTVSGLANGTAYYFVVTAVIGGAETLPSPEVGVTPQLAPPASAPSGVTATPGNGQVTLKWSPVPNTSSYNVYFGNGVALYYGNVEVYNPATNTWSQKAPMPTPRQGMAVSVVNGRIYAIGGWGGWPELSKVEVYDPVSNTWSLTVPITPATIAAGTAAKPLAPMPTARDDFGFAVLNGTIYAIGGDTNAFDAVLGIPCCTTVVEAYDTVNNTWSTKASMPTMRDDFDASMVGGVIYAIAGSRDGRFLDPTLPNNGGFSLVVNEAYRSSSIPVPNGVTATPGAGQVSLGWNAVAGATSYNVYWSNKAGVSTKADSTMIPNVNATTYTHTGLTAGKWYYYVVTAVTSSGESLPSDEVAIKP